MSGDTSEHGPAHKETDFDQTVALLKEALKDVSPEWQRTLYQAYTQRFISDNARIWTTGAILIPVSLGAFVALTAINRPTGLHIWLLAAASLVLMFLWLVVAENHRAFQEKSLAWTRAMESLLGLDDTGGVKIRGNPLSRILTSPAAVQLTRWYLFVLVLVAWILISLFWPRT